MTWQCGRLNRTDEMVSRRPDPCGANARDEHCLNYTSGTCRQQTTRGVVRLCETRVSLSCSMTRSSSICVSLDTGGVLATRPRRAGYSARQRPLLTACFRPVMLLGSQFQTTTSPGQAAHATRPPPDSAPCPGGMFVAGCKTRKPCPGADRPRPGGARDATPPPLLRQPVPDRLPGWKADSIRPRALDTRCARYDPLPPSGGLFHTGHVAGKPFPAARGPRPGGAHDATPPPLLAASSRTAVWPNGCT